MGVTENILILVRTKLYNIDFFLFDNKATLGFQLLTERGEHKLSTFSINTESVAAG